MPARREWSAPALEQVPACAVHPSCTVPQHHSPGRRLLSHHHPLLHVLGALALLARACGKGAGRPRGGDR